MEMNNYISLTFYILSSLTTKNPRIRNIKHISWLVKYGLNTHVISFHENCQ